MSAKVQSVGMRIVRAIAESEAIAADFANILPEHFWMAISRTAEMVEDSAGRLLENAEDQEMFGLERRALLAWFSEHRIEIGTLRRAVRTALGSGPGKEARPHRSSSSIDAYRIADKIAQAEGKSCASPVHLCQALYDRPTPLLRAVLGRESEALNLNSPLAAKKKGPTNIVPPAPTPATLMEAPTAPPATAPVAPPPAAPPPAAPVPLKGLLAKVGRDMVALAKKGVLHPVVGRKDELRRLAQILGQKQKCNALLVGDAGVGKTQLVEGLAERIASGKCPAAFLNKRIIELSVSALLAGAQYRGDFEGRLEEILNEAENDPNLILFIDEFHTAVGAGKSSGALDACAILKPALGRAGIRVIGATTAQAYDESIARDPALARRFDVVWVEEPSRDETLEILTGLKAGFEEHHALIIAPEALEAAVDLSMRYLTDRRLPDKAIDVLDQACSQRAIPTMSPDRTRHDSVPPIMREDIARIVSARTRIPLDLLAASDSQRLSGLESQLNGVIFGQTAAMARISRDLRTAYNGLRDPKRPIASFLFAGPTGVGKSETARALADYLFGQKESLIVIDLSEYSEKHQLARLIGAPPGYVGYHESGTLTSALRRRPACVVLFDEVEKAHPDVLNILLQILDEARLTDGHSRTTSFREAIVIMTTNVPGGAADGVRAGFRPDRPAVQAESILFSAMEAFLKPELLGRIGSVVEFTPLDRAAIEAIVRGAFAEIAKRAAAKSPPRIPPDELREAIVREIGELKFGAREIQKIVETRIAEWLERGA